MYIPKFAIKEAELNILKSNGILLKEVVLKDFTTPLVAYQVDENEFNKVLKFTEEFNENLIESVVSRSQLLKAVTLTVNIMARLTKIQDADLKTATAAGVMATIVSMYNMAPEYANRLMSILKGKI